MNLSKKCSQKSIPKLSVMNKNRIVNFYLHTIKYLRSLRYFGAHYTCIIILEKIFTSRKYEINIIHKKNALIMNYLLKKYKYVIDEFKEKTNKGVIQENGNIWVCWWQGEKNAPEIIKKCLALIRKNAGDHTVVFIDKNNYKEYAYIPSYIIKKFEAGVITITHFSDILRTALLYEHGGLWIDSTIFVSKQIPNCIFKTHLFSQKENEKEFIAKRRWATFIIGGSKGSIIFDFTRKILFEYWKTENELINYFLIDYCIAIGYDSVPEIKLLVDKIPLNNPQTYGLHQLLNNPFNQQIFDNLLKDTIFHKLNWKGNFVRYTVDGHKTFYEHMLSDLQ